jgi:amidase
MSTTDLTIWREHGWPLRWSTASGSLNGLTVAVKDLFAVGGFPVGAGNPRWLERATVEPADSWAVRTLRAAGASIAGIAQTDELAFSLSGTNIHYGTPPNPAAPDLVTGGSTSGPAAAVASGQADIGLGTDTGGSVRVPASVCGLYGMRPTHGAVPLDGVLNLAPSFDTVGWLARDPEILRAAGDVLLPDTRVSPPARLLLSQPATMQTAELIAALGIDVRVGPVGALDDRADLLVAFRTVQSAEAWRTHGRWILANPGALAPDVEARFRAGAEVDTQLLHRASATIGARRDRLLDVLGDDNWLVLPAAAGPGHARDATAEAKDAWRQATLLCTVVASAFGLPSCVLPGPGRLPVGVALVGPPGADRSLLEVAARAAHSQVGA